MNRTDLTARARRATVACGRNLRWAFRALAAGYADVRPSAITALLIAGTAAAAFRGANYRIVDQFPNRDAFLVAATATVGLAVAIAIVIGTQTAQRWRELRAANQDTAWQRKRVPVADRVGPFSPPAPWGFPPLLPEGTYRIETIGRTLLPVIAAILTEIGPVSVKGSTLGEATIGTEAATIQIGVRSNSGGWLQYSVVPAGLPNRPVEV